MTSNAGFHLDLSGCQNHSTLPTYTQFHLCLLPSRLDFWWKTSGQPVDMENIRISHFSQGVISNRWCRNSSINSIIQTNGCVFFEKVRKPLLLLVTGCFLEPKRNWKNICSSQLGNHFRESLPHVLKGVNRTSRFNPLFPPNHQKETWDSTGTIWSTKFLQNAPQEKLATKKKFIAPPDFLGSMGSIYLHFFDFYGGSMWIDPYTVHCLDGNHSHSGSLLNRLETLKTSLYYPRYVDFLVVN